MSAPLQSEPWSAARYFAALARLQEIGDPESAREVNDLEEAYIETVPTPALARCPFTSELLVHSLETRGLDRLWWRYENPVRPVDDAPETLVALAGAVRLQRAQLEAFPFLCKPGPEVPFVIPRLLESGATVAVISQVAVGPHQGFPIAYFAPVPHPPDVARFNDWGSDHYESIDGWGSVSEDSEPLDFNLAPWISAGRLQWIAPGDQGMELRNSVDGCPYLGLDGRRSFQRIQNGRVWGPDDGISVPPTNGRN